MTAAVSRDLALWVSELRYDAIPQAVRDHLKYCLLDAFGCGLYGASQPWGGIVSETALASTGSGGAALFAGGGCASPAEAALANGTAVHGFEIDDVHVASSLHPGAVVIPAVLATLTGRAVSGPELICALAAGYEAGIRLGMSAGVKHSTSGFHVTGTVGTVAAGMAAARLLGLNAAATLNALGIAATQASGLYSARKGAMTKRLHAGLAARAGVTGALLAERGFTGSGEVLEADFGGFFSTLNGEHPPASLLDELGDRWETERVGFKAYASCASSHTTVDVLDELSAKGLSLANLERLELGLSRKGALNVGWPYRPDTVVSAQMNAQYVAAVKLLEGQVFVQQFRDDLLNDPRVMAIIGKISTHHDPDIDALGVARRHTVRAKATLCNGEVITAEVQQRKGSAERPLPPEDIVAKFHSLAAVADFVDSRAVERAILAIETSADVGAALAAPLLVGERQPR